MLLAVVLVITNAMRSVSINLAERGSYAPGFALDHLISY